MQKGLPSFIRLAAKLRRHERGIIAHACDPIRTTRVDGLNNRIKVIKRKSYGFLDPDHCALKIKHALPGSICT